MPLFRFQRGSLSDSMKTVIEVKDKKELLEVINKNLQPFGIFKEENIKIEPYCYDKRIDWDTQIVSTYCRSSPQLNCVHGFLNKPFD
jgi:hypothetical protein